MWIAPAVSRDRTFEGGNGVGIVSSFAVVTGGRQACERGGDEGDNG
jgi:hypothetical protein